MLLVVRRLNEGMTQYSGKQALYVSRTVFSNQSNIFLITYDVGNP